MIHAWTGPTHDWPCGIHDWNGPTHDWACPRLLMSHEWPKSMTGFMTGIMKIMTGIFEAIQKERTRQKNQFEIPLNLQFKEKTLTSLIQTGEGFSLNLIFIGNDERPKI